MDVEVDLRKKQQHKRKRTKIKIEKFNKSISI